MSKSYEGTFTYVLQELKKHARGNGSTQGKLFEKLTKSFLENYDLYQKKFKQVWLWDEYPDRRTRGGFGVDLVAESHDGKRIAIQCKFYTDKLLTKPDIDSFLEAGSRSEFDSMMLVHTSLGYGKKVEDALKGHNCQVLDFKSLANCNVEWPDLAKNLVDIKKKEPFNLREHQKEALQKVTTGFQDTDRGKMIMACGTGKTLTSLHIAETMVGKGGLVLYAVPSISLMQQTIREWSEQRRLEHTYIGVCSDSKVSHGEKSDIPIIEMNEVGVTTDVNQVTKVKRNNNTMTVIFSTYQSMEVIVDSEKNFDLIICDEAHRTTGVERDEKSPFLLVHDDVKSKKRLYMTATPKIYGNPTKTRAEIADVTLYSMDGDVYGKELYHLSFSKAIDKQLLSDYKVLVLSINQKYVASILPKIINAMGKAGDINLTDAGRMIGIHQALLQPENNTPNAKTAIVFTNTIKDSKRFAETFKELDVNENDPFSCDARHVDGSQNASIRADALQWLRDSKLDTDECRILTNARCLSEGVDVPALDAICFTNPKSSQVDVIQAVGRVMRKTKNKKIGYVIIPVVVPEESDADQILQNDSFDIVWSVLRALRSHDERFDIKVNTADLNKQLPSNLNFIGLDNEGKRRDSTPEKIPLSDLDVPADFVTVKIVDEVGDRAYFEHWAKDVADIVPKLSDRINNVITSGKAKTKFNEFMTGLRQMIHDGITDEEGIDMLAQHMITRRIFEAMFGSFSNPVSASIDKVIQVLRENGLDTELRDLEKFYTSIEKRISNLETHEGRQKVISELYGTFFKIAFPKMADRLGIVYTPIEIVDFILKSVNHVLEQEFDSTISSKGVNVIDPFTGAGTFLARLLSDELNLIQNKDLKQKYQNELFANETVLLAYYIASINCESAYKQRMDKFKEFSGISLKDTFTDYTLDEDMGNILAESKQRIKKQRKTKIKVIVGNPPYSAGQSNFNDQNQNVSYPDIDKRIEGTYVSKTKTINPKIGLTRSLYDSYIRSIRWASDRIGESGIIGFVTNGSFIKSEAAAGLRVCFQDEFTDVWIFDLLGKKGMDGHGRNVFEYPGISTGGTTTQIAILILVKNPKKKEHIIHYSSLTKADYSGPDKRRKVKELESINGITDWNIIKPDKHHDWLNQRTSEFQNYLPMGSKDAKVGKGNAVFENYSNGVKTHRDAWVYNSSKKELSKNMKGHIKYCNSQDLDHPIIDSKQAKWSGELSTDLKRHGEQKFSKNKIRNALYRPFFKQYTYFDPQVYSHRTYQIPKFFPENDSENLTVNIPDKGIGDKFSALVTDKTPDLHLIAQSQCFPLKIKKDSKVSEREKRNLCIIVPCKIQKEFSVFITNLTPDLEVIHHGQVFPMKVIE